MQALETGRKASIQQTFRAYLTSAHRFYFYWQYIVFILQCQKVLNTTPIWLKRTETNTVLIVFKGVSFPYNLQYTCICFFLFSVHSAGARNRKLYIYIVYIPFLCRYILTKVIEEFLCLQFDNFAKIKFVCFFFLLDLELLLELNIHVHAHISIFHTIEQKVMYQVNTHHYFKTHVYNFYFSGKDKCRDIVLWDLQWEDSWFVGIIKREGKEISCKSYVQNIIIFFFKC